jgi:hypothetical protein
MPDNLPECQMAHNMQLTTTRAITCSLEIYGANLVLPQKEFLHCSSRSSKIAIFELPQQL